MARPTEKEKASAVNLWLSQETKESGKSIAESYYDKRSLSWLVERLLKNEIKRRKADLRRKARI